MRYEAKIGRKRHDLNESRIGGHKHTPYSEYRFVMWDGEAPQDTGYSLFGSSDGHEICKPHLTTEECFDLLLQAKSEDRETIFFWFGGRYDWDEITRQSIPLVKLARLKHAGVIHWHGYRLSECEGKIYTISKAGNSCTIYDVSGWFHCPYITALSKYDIGSPSERLEISDGKDNRADFLWSEIESIARYMRLELKLGPPLMDCIRDIVLNAGFNPRGWYGPSALARECFKRYSIYEHMAQCPEEVNDAACFAFAGGRFEGFLGGILGESTTIDQNSAYMFAALDLPCLAHGQWHKGRDYQPGKFALYHIRYDDRERANVRKPYPLFRRMPNGNVCWPRRVDGWYWTPEAELVATDHSAHFIESWWWEPSCNHQPFAFVQELFAQRLVMQEEGNPAEKALKWALAAIFGQCARAVGYNRKLNLPPRTHQIEWAGYITSKCRAEMFRLASASGNRLVSIDTDSVTVLGDPAWVNSHLGDALGDNLGQWKTEHSAYSVVFQNGVYFTHDGTEWSQGKTRGMERRQGTPAVTPELLAKAITSGKAVKLLPKRRYVTTKMALNGQIDSHGEWRDHPANTLYFGGGGKRYHNSRLCDRYCSGTVHTFLPKPQGLDEPWNIKSVPHYLPWKEQTPPAMIDSGELELLWIDTGRIDSDDTWKAVLIESRTQKTDAGDLYRLSDTAADHSP